MKRWTWLVGCGLVCGAFAACGGADQSSLYEDSGTAPPDGSPQKDANPPGPDGGPQKDTGVVDAPPLQDVAPDVPIIPDSKIHCGNTACSAQTEVCCATAGATSFTYACVSSIGDCSGIDQIPISCSSAENCASQGNSGYMCCGSPNGPVNPNPQCGSFTSAASVQCQATCDPNQQEFEVGCSTSLQNCTDTQQQCITSQCTLPGYNICR